MGGIDFDVKDPETIADFDTPMMNDSKAGALMDANFAALTDVNAGPKDWYFMWRSEMFSTRSQISGVPTRLEMKKAVMTLQRFSISKKVEGSDHFLKEIGAILDVNSDKPNGGGNRLKDVMNVVFTSNGDA